MPLPFLSIPSTYRSSNGPIDWQTFAPSVFQEFTDSQVQFWWLPEAALIILLFFFGLPYCIFTCNMPELMIISVFITWLWVQLLQECLLVSNILFYLFSQTSFFLSLLKPFWINSMHWLWDFWIKSFSNFHDLCQIQFSLLPLSALLFPSFILGFCF